MTTATTTAVSTTTETTTEEMLNSVTYVSSISVLTTSGIYQALAYLGGDPESEYIARLK
jgi:hypothetical protein